LPEKPIDDLATRLNIKGEKISPIERSYCDIIEWIRYHEKDLGDLARRYLSYP